MTNAPTTPDYVTGDEARRILADLTAAINAYTAA